MSRTQDIHTLPDRQEANISQTALALQIIMIRWREECGLSASRDECGCIRAQVCIPHAPPYAAARAAGRALSLSARWRLRDPSGEAGPVPDFPILARVGGPPAGMGEDGQVLSGNRQGPADPNQERAGTGRGDAAGASETVPVRARLRRNLQSFRALRGLGRRDPWP